jgi:hypothetical protein
MDLPFMEACRFTFGTILLEPPLTRLWMSILLFDDVVFLDASFGLESATDGATIVPLQFFNWRFDFCN